MKFLLFALIAFVNIQLIFGENPQIRFSSGELKGIFLKSRGGKTYSAFLGIPYAKPPKRFQLAEFSEPWNGIRDATKYGNQCWQRAGLISKAGGSEDCLFVNIYAPGKMTKKNLPVMVFIHGGGFAGGSGNEYGANFFMDHDVVLVTLNYRVGALGFLSTGDGVIEGNLGLKDQHLALQWVQKNIQFFGGNPKKVTLFGESAGAASVHYHVLSPLSEGLFQQAILQSGTANAPWAYTDKPAEAAFDLGNTLGCNTNSSKELLKCLEEKSAEDIINVEKRKWYLDPLVFFPPSRDSPRSKQVFVPESPIALLESGNSRIPIMLTVCQEEGLLVHGAVVSRTEKLRKEMNEDWFRILPITLNYDNIGLPNSLQNWISSQAKNFYLGGKGVGEETLMDLTNMYSDRWFIYAAEKAAKLHAKHTTVYNGLLSYRGQNSLLSVMGIKESLGVTHGDDLMYLFNGELFPKLASNSADEEASKFLVSTWVNFATTGKPEIKWENVKWVPFSTRKTTWFNLNFPPEVLDNPFKERMEFWDKMWNKLYKDEL